MSKELFETPRKTVKYVMYAALLLLLAAFILHAFLTPDVQTNDLGNVKSGERLAGDGYTVSAQMNHDASGHMKGVIEIYFDDAARMPKDFLLAASYDDRAVGDLLVICSYMLDGKEYHSQVDALDSYDMKSAVGGMGFRQPFPRGARNRKISFQQIATKGSQKAVGYIATGSQLHNCDVADGGLLHTINAKKSIRLGDVQLVKFTFQKQG